jgi:gliding motility-associated-like protein
MNKNLLLFILLFLSIGCFAQGEANIWYFGNKAGLDFNSGSPVALTDSQMVTDEGCAVLSNSAGQLLFYTDGSTVWNKNHQVMQNGSGLLGHYSSTQSATIIQKPGSSNLFYVFTIDAEGGINGFRYSVIDILLDNGLGAIITKNILIYTPTCEKISIVKHANGIDFWVLTHGLKDTFYSYLVTPSGINNSPQVSNIGINLGLNVFGSVSQGIMKLSPDGTKLAICHLGFQKVELFDFNAATGVISNPRMLLNGTNSYDNVYGAEFSPSGKILYITGVSLGVIYQFDLTATVIASSKIEIPTLNSFLGSLQMGPDRKIYLANNNTSSLSVINKPDVLGLGCDFQNFAIDLGGKVSAIGLPSFNQSFFFKAEIEFHDACIGNNTSITLISDQTIISAIWDFGDGFTSNTINPTHQYTIAGTYKVSVAATSTIGTITKTRYIVISAIPTATKPQDLLICDSNNDGFTTFDLTSQNTAILNGQDANAYTVTYFANATDYANNIAIATPNNYVNATEYQAQTIIAEVSNNANSECKSSTNFNIDVFDSPKPSAVVPKISSCDNTSVGTDVDGRVLFDLTQNATPILNGQSANQFLLSYYKDSALTQGIAGPNAYANTNVSETIYVKMTNKDNVACFATTSFSIEVLALPVITNVVSLKQCDDTIDGFSVFNLEEAIGKITANAANETIVFYKSSTDAQNNTAPITNPTTYTNQAVSNDAVYAKITNGNACFRIAKVNLFVSTTQIPLNYSKSFTECDDAILGTNTDGIASFDFSSVTAEIQNIFPMGQLLDIRYFRNLADALAEKNAITDISNYRNIGYPNTQKIYIRVDSQVNNDCLGLGSHITLNVERIPIVQALTQIHCDDDQDGKFAFDTTNLQTQLLNGLTNVSVSYFDQNNVPLSSPLPNSFVTATQKLKVTVTNNTPKACSYSSTIQFVVDDLPEAFAVPSNLTTTCDDEADPNLQDGKYAFDTSTFQNTILGGQTGMTIKYFDANNNLLSTPLANPFVTATQNVRVEVINPINTTCTATITLPFVVNPVPKIALTGDELVCSDLPSFTKVLDAGLLDGSPTTDYSYAWSFNGNAIAGETNYILTVNTAGIYTVTVTNNQGCFSMRTFTVVASDKANITDVKIVDLAESNSITVSVAASLGDYVYALDDEFGAYQTDTIFNNVSAGIHTIYVKDLNGCGIERKEVSVLGIPNFFTPNDDNYNDYWNIKGVNASFNANTIIYIFDRYGKLIKQISPLAQGWNGTFNGQPMPASDYWYSIQLEDGRVVKGHFALKR